jgi:hypothetical protein
LEREPQSKAYHAVATAVGDAVGGYRERSDFAKSTASESAIWVCKDGVLVIANGLGAELNCILFFELKVAEDTCIASSSKKPGPRRLFLPELP